MKQITPTHFENAVRENPAWATTLREPVEIVGHCFLYKSPITHLSPLLHFSGRSKRGDVAIFRDCASLKVAEGTFNGGVTFRGSGIVLIDIDNFIITQTNHMGQAALFTGCQSLKVAEGRFPDAVDFRGSAVESIGLLKFPVSDNDCDYAMFENTPILKKEPSKVGSRLFGRIWDNRLYVISKVVTFAPETKLALDNHIKARIDARIVLKSVPTLEL